MKITLFMTMSLNGITSDDTGTEDFLADKNWDLFTEKANETGCVIWGRKTYEAVKTWPEEYLKKLKAEIIVVSRKGKSPFEALKEAANKGYKEAILAGGPETNTYFLKEKLVDEIIVNIEPVLASGKKYLFEATGIMQELQLLNERKIGGIIQLHYKVLK